MNSYFDSVLGPRRNSFAAQYIPGEYIRAREERRHSLARAFDALRMDNRRSTRLQEYRSLRRQCYAQQPFQQQSRQPIYEERRPIYQQEHNGRRPSLFEWRPRVPSIRQREHPRHQSIDPRYNDNRRDRVPAREDFRAGLVDAQFGGQGRGLRRAPERRQVGRCSVPGYTFVRSLGPGGMSDAVNVVEDTRSRKLYVEKRIGVNGNSVTYKRVEAEIHALRTVRGVPNLNQIVTSLDQPPNISMILEFCDQGSLEQKLKDKVNRDSKFEERYIWHTFLSMAQALAFLHHGISAPGDRPGRGWDMIWHLDIKPCNVFLSSTHIPGSLPRVVLGDFGCSVTESSVRSGMEHPRLQGYGTPDWYPPEGLPQIAGPGRTRYGPETDIWQLGAMIHTLCRLIRSPDRTMVTSGNSCGRAYSSTLNYEVGKCVCPEFERRPTARELLENLHSIARSRRM
ncbi:hypothetical protein LTR86_007747 [Recurvomyces mirabilis]|nr:hypothetical protein LTR86_007747 [Recurvomyces mirabilis]